MKNIFTIAIFVISAAIAYIEFGISEGQAQCLPIKEDKKLPPLEVIKLAEIHGISLRTSVGKVDGLLSRAGYSCNKTENTASSGNLQSRITNWTCSNEKFKSKMNILSENNEIKKITSAGSAYLKDMNYSLDLLNYLRSLLNTRKGLSFFENERNVGFNILAQKKDGQVSYVKYQINYKSTDNKDLHASKDINEIGGEMSVLIVR